MAKSCPTLCSPRGCSSPGSPWDSPGKNIGVGCQFFLQGIFPGSPALQAARFLTVGVTRWVGWRQVSPSFWDCLHVCSVVSSSLLFAFYLNGFIQYVLYYVLVSSLGITRQSWDSSMWLCGSVEMSAIPLFGSIFISSSFLKSIFVVYRILTKQFFFKLSVL